MADEPRDEDMKAAPVESSSTPRASPDPTTSKPTSPAMAALDGNEGDEGDETQSIEMDLVEPPWKDLKRSLEDMIQRQDEASDKLCNEWNELSRVLLHSGLLQA